MENEYGASKYKQFTVQNLTEVRVLNLDKFAPQYDFMVMGKEDKQNGRVKRETFHEFRKRNPPFFSEQEDLRHQSYPPVDQVQEGDGHAYEANV